MCCYKASAWENYIIKLNIFLLNSEDSTKGEDIKHNPHKKLIENLADHGMLTFNKFLQ